MLHETMLEIVNRIAGPPDGRSKRAHLYARYEPYFAALRDEPVKVLELGVHIGESLKIFSAYFRRGNVVGADVENTGVDLSSYPNAIFETADQRKGERLRALSSTHAPHGWDIVIDDAAHYGSWSLLAYQALFPLLKPGGLYVVEDWMTGYWDDWPDGNRYQRFGVDVPQDHIPKRMPSHDSGMVGFVKSLIDEIIDRPATTRESHISHPRTVEWMHIHEPFAILKKRG